MTSIAAWEQEWNELEELWYDEAGDYSSALILHTLAVQLARHMPNGARFPCLARQLLHWRRATARSPVLTEEQILAEKLLLD